MLFVCFCTDVCCSNCPVYPLAVFEYLITCLYICQVIVISWLGVCCLFVNFAKFVRFTVRCTRSLQHSLKMTYVGC